MFLERRMSWEASSNERFCQFPLELKREKLKFNEFYKSLII